MVAHLGCATLFLTIVGTDASAVNVKSSHVKLTFAGGAKALWTYGTGSGPPLPVAPPTFLIDGKRVRAQVTKLQEVERARPLANGSVEHHLRGQVQGDATLTLDLRFRVSDRSPIVRFMYGLSSSVPGASGGANEVVIREASSTGQRINQTKW